MVVRKEINSPHAGIRNQSILLVSLLHVTPATGILPLRTTVPTTSSVTSSTLPLEELAYITMTLEVAGVVMCIEVDFCGLVGRAGVADLRCGDLRCAGRGCPEDRHQKVEGDLKAPVERDEAKPGPGTSGEDEGVERGYD